MVRAPCFYSNGMKKGAWSEEEDNKLRNFVFRYGHWNWRLLPKYAGLARCGKSCRLRWVNYLKPGVKRGNFSKQEKDLIIKLHAQFGNKWSIIATKLPGRTDNDIKNFWHTQIKKCRRKQNPAAKKVTWHGTIEADSSKDQVMKEKKVSAFTLRDATRDESDSLDADSFIKLQQSTLSFDTNFSQPEVDLWADIFLGDASYNQNDYFLPPMEEEFSYADLHYRELSSSGSSYMSVFDWIADDDHNIISSESVAQPIQGSFLSESFASNASNSQYESCYNIPPPPQEVGGFYDPCFQHFDYGMNFFN